jgi:hypothetical protein
MALSALCPKADLRVQVLGLRDGRVPDHDDLTVPGRDAVPDEEPIAGRQGRLHRPTTNHGEAELRHR